MDDRLFQLIKQGATIRQLQLMLETGIDVNGYNERQETPLMSAMMNVHDVKKREQIVRMILLYCANINCRNLRGQTPLMYACILDQLDTLNILLKEPKLDANLQDFEGNTALMYACALGNIESVRKLVSAHQHGTIDLDPCLANAEGTTAIDYAEDSRDEELKALVNAVMVVVSVSPVNETNDVDKCGDENESKNKISTLKTSTRIKQLASTIEEINKHRGSGSSSAIDKTLMVWKGTDDGNANVAWSSKTPTPSKESLLPKKKSVLNIHLPRAHEELRHELENPTFSGDHTPLPESDNQKENYSPLVISPYTNPPQTPTNWKSSKRAKKNKKKRGKKRRTPGKDSDDIADENIFLFADRPPKREFGDEIVFCNKIYGADLYPCEEEEKMENTEMRVSDIVESITHKALVNFKKAKETHVDFDIDKMAVTTGKLDYLMTAQDRGKLLGRTIWSIYGEPLPPIPITRKTMEKVILGITRLQRHLGKAKYQPGRLLSLDPEMWCIVESMKSRNVTYRPRPVIMPKHEIVWPELTNYR